MSANKFRCRGALLLTLVLFAGSGRQIASGADDEPTATLAEESAADDGGSDSLTSDAEPNTDFAPPAMSAVRHADDNAPLDASADEADAAKTDDAPASAPAKLPSDDEAAALPNETTEAGDPVADDEAAKAAAESRSPLVPAHGKAKTEAASFKGIQPGHASSAELTKLWGPPHEIRKSDGLRLQTYQIESFPKVSVALASGIVTSIVVNLETTVEPDALAKQLEIDDVSSVQVTDENGQLLGEAFPERGVLFGYDPKAKTTLVSQIVLEPIDAAPFLLRAESYSRTHYARSLADANAALQLDPQSAQAQGLRARVYRRAGDYALALKTAEAAGEIEPEEVEWKLLSARIQIDSGDFDKARGQIEQVLDVKNSSPLTRSRAHLLMGDCIAQGAGHDQHAMKHYVDAIKLAEPLVKNTRVAVRRGAKEVLLDAHLGVAQDIGWGHWQQKNQAIARWAERAGAWALDLVQHEQGEEDLLFRVDAGVLAALAGVAEPGDASTWIGNCQRRAAKLIEESPDRARAAEFEWMLGMALSDAAEIEQARGDADHALKYGRLALEHMEAGEAAARQLPGHDFLVGRLYYRLGVAAAVGKGDHKLALEWYGRAVKLLEAPVPPSRLADPGRQGETFVSAAVSYWEQGDRDEALRLTRQGIKLMEIATEEGQLVRSALAIPYGNLASMHAELGDKKLATEFAALAAKCEREKR